MADEQVFQYIDGRKYVANVPYMLPKDLEEMNRLDFQHYVLRNLLKGNYLSPVQDPHNVLDIGCGTGRWMREVATTFPQANVMGIDLVDPREQAGVLPFPSNCVFTKGNVMNGLPFVNDTFDFVYQRLLVLGLPRGTWSGLLNEILRVTKPGGWIESIEVNMTGQRLGPEMERLARWTHEIALARGCDPMLPEKLAPTFTEAGLTNVVSKVFSIPVGNWGGRVGRAMVQDVLAVLKASRSFVAAHAGISLEEYDRIVALGIQEYDLYRSYSNFYVTYGQCPG